MLSASFTIMPILKAIGKRVVSYLTKKKGENVEYTKHFIIIIIKCFNGSLMRRRVLLLLLLLLPSALFAETTTTRGHRAGIPEEAHADESIMRNQRVLASSMTSSHMRWNTRASTAKQICARNRHGAEWSGLLNRSQLFIDELNREMDGGGGHVTFFDSARHQPVFKVHKRPLHQFLEESVKHGWPSFRVEDVVWENVRVLEDGEVVTKDGLHLGHNIPDDKGPRLCINLVCVSGFAPEE